VLVSLVLYNSLLLGVLALLLQRPVGKEWYNPMLLQIHLPSAFGTWSGTPNSSQHSPSAIWSARASWLECLPGIASILQHLSCGLSDSSVSGDVAKPCSWWTSCDLYGSYVGVCCQECVAKPVSLIQEPAGAGKTLTSAMIVYDLAKQGQGLGITEILALGPSTNISASLDCLYDFIL
jgi:hypothetical protein